MEPTIQTRERLGQEHSQQRASKPQLRWIFLPDITVPVLTLLGRDGRPGGVLAGHTKSRVSPKTLS